MTRCAPPAIPFLRIEYAETNDDPIDHQPVVPGIITDDEFWALVAHLPGGRTRWRRLSLSSSPVAKWRAASGDQTRAP